MDKLTMKFNGKDVPQVWFTRKEVIALLEAEHQASRKQALEEAAAACDANRDDARQAEMLAMWRKAEKEKQEEFCRLQLGQAWSTVSTYNAGLSRAADAIRSLEGNATKETT